MLTPDQLRRSKDKAVVAYNEFALHTRQGRNGLFCFFEGKDAPYYLPRIRRYYSGVYHIVKCGGKEKVIKVYDLISFHPQYSSYRKLFFIDRDFSRSLPLERMIFETPCYSIENLYVSVDVFKEILKSEMDVSEINEAFEILVTLYNQRQREFHDAILLFNSWYACLIERREREQIETGANLDEKPPKGFIDIQIDVVRMNYSEEAIRKHFPLAIVVGREQMDRKIASFQASEMHKAFRGKYELHFLISILKLIVEDSRGEKKYLKREIADKSIVGLNNDQAISRFSPYAETPKSLIEYIQKAIRPA